MAREILKDVDEDEPDVDTGVDEPGNDDTDDWDKERQPHSPRIPRALRSATASNTKRVKHLNDKPARLPVKWEPRFWRDSDQRLAAVRFVKHRIKLLQEDCGADSVQKQMLCERAGFIAILLESQEVIAAEGGGLDWGSYVQAANALNGLLKHLGLERHQKQVHDLRSYVEGKRKA